MPVWRIPVALPPTASVYACDRGVIRPGETERLRFEVVKNTASSFDDDLTRGVAFGAARPFRGMVGAGNERAHHPTRDKKKRHRGERIQAKSQGDDHIGKLGGPSAPG